MDKKIKADMKEIRAEMKAKVSVTRVRGITGSVSARHWEGGALPKLSHS